MIYLSNWSHQYMVTSREHTNGKILNLSLNKERRYFVNKLNKSLFFLFPDNLFRMSYYSNLAKIFNTTMYSRFELFWNHFMEPGRLCSIRTICKIHTYKYIHSETFVNGRYFISATCVIGKFQTNKILLDRKSRI